MIFYKGNKYDKIKSFTVMINEKNKEKNLREIYKDDNEIKYFKSKDNILSISYQMRGKKNTINVENRTNKLNLLLGDDSEIYNVKDRGFLANGVKIQLDLERNFIEIHTSIVGLPPVYLVKNENIYVITSDIYTIYEMCDINFSFNLKSICELGHIGHPVDYKTLFKNIEMVKPGSLVHYSIKEGIVIKNGWNYETRDTCDNWDKYIELQTNVFDDAIKEMDLSNTFLSLTAGLDTRAIFAANVKLRLYLPAFTISGINLSLDARIAGKLCSHYGNDHTVITVNENFINDLPNLSYEASKLSGGVSSLSQAHEVFFYKQIPDGFESRLSGNLGNQIGRFGTEGVSLRNADLEIINKDVLSFIKYSKKHWIMDSALSNREKFYKFLLNNEIPFSSVANYAIGNHYLIQKSPYANKKLIEIAKRIPANPKNWKIPSTKKIVINDLKHRFIGESNKFSFQIKYIRDVGGYVSKCPINWGMNANKHMSLYGLFYGSLSLVDIFLSKKSIRNEMVKTLSKNAKIDGIHVFIPLPRILKNRLKEFVIDTLSSKRVGESHLFNKRMLEKNIWSFYQNDGKNAENIIFAMDVAIAMNIFNANI